MKLHMLVAGAVSLALSVIVFAGDDDYAEPVGEDAYGTTYQIREVPTRMTEAFDDQGSYALPSFIDATIYHDEQESWVSTSRPLRERPTSRRRP